MSISEQDVLNSITAKSDQLNACDLVGGAITVTVKGVSKGADDQPICMAIEGRQPYKPCKSMRRVLVACWGANPNAWIGRKMTLYSDASVKWAGEEVGGIRISHLSHMQAEKKVLVNVSKGKKGGYVVKPLHDEIDARFAKLKAAINSADSKEQAEKVWKLGAEVFKLCSDDQANELDVAYKAKLELFK